MNLIKPKFEILEQQPGIDGIYKMIELAGRTCYRSEDKITPDSAVAFVDRMIKSGHGAMLEHGTVYLKIINSHLPSPDFYIWEKYEKNPYSKVNIIQIENSESGNIYITTNLRVLVENGWMDDLHYICEPTKFHEKRITVRFICDRGVSHEFVRHRVFSFAQESTRYCNYSKSKFNGELTFIIPNWLNIPEGKYWLEDSEDVPFSVETTKNSRMCWYNKNAKYAIADDSPIGEYLDLLQHSENTYEGLLDEGWKPQQARAILPNSLKTELVMTGFVSDWKHFFKLRDAGSAHPQAQELAKPLHEEFIKRGYITTHT